MVNENETYIKTVLEEIETELKEGKNIKRNDEWKKMSVIITKEGEKNDESN